MNELTHQKTDFKDIYDKSYRLAAAVFMVSNVMSQDEELKTKIRKLSLELVSLSVNLKDTDFSQTKKIISDIERNSLELMSMLDIASVSGLISKMNGDIIKQEFRIFMSELERFTEKFEENKNISVKSVFAERASQSAIGIEAPLGNNLAENVSKPNSPAKVWQKSAPSNGNHHNGLKRKDLRRNTILEFIKNHNNVSIKDIVPHINGCSEKTVQRELITLINEGKIKKMGERRWSKYSIL